MRGTITKNGQIQMGHHFAIQATLFGDKERDMGGERCVDLLQLLFRDSRWIFGDRRGGLMKIPLMLDYFPKCKSTKTKCVVLFRRPLKAVR